MKEVIRTKGVLVLTLVAILVFGFVRQAKAQGEIGPLLNDDIVISTGQSCGDKADIAFDGERYLVVWPQYYDLNNFFADIYGRFITTSGDLVGEPFSIAHGIRNQHDPAVAFNGTYYLVVYYNNVPNEIRGRLVGTDGSLIGSEFVISNSSSENYPDVASDGTNFLVIWADHRNHSTNYGDIYGQFVSANGALISANFQISGPQDQSWPSVEFGSTGYLVIWRNRPEPNIGEVDLYGALVDTQGTVSEPIAVSTAPNCQSSWMPPGISFNGTTKNYLVVWDDYRDGYSCQIYGTRVSETGELLDGPPNTGGIAISTNAGAGSPSGAHVAFDGANWLVVWGGSRIRGAQVSPSGTVLDPSGVDLYVTPTSQWFPGIASDGTNYLVTWYMQDSQDTKYAQLVGPISTNAPPTADAGPDQTVNEGDPVTLDGSGSSDPDNDPLTYQWSQVAGPAVSLDTNNPVYPTFDSPWVDAGGATLTFRLIVSDGELDSNLTLVNITVKNVNNPPVADAGVDQTVQEGSPVTLDGSGSYDLDNESITYSWIQTAGSQVSLSGSDTAIASFTAPLVGSAGETLSFKLTVSDGIDSTIDTVSVFVENVNHAPTANAGEPQTVNEGTPVTLYGAGNDPDNDLLTFVWTQIDGVSVTLSDSNAQTPSFTAPAVVSGGDTLIFQLVVNDGLAYSEPDEVAITVLDINDPPACDLAQASPDRLWPPNHKLVTVEIVGVADPDNDEVTISVDSVTQDEPVDGIGDGDTSPDAVIQGDKVLLRAERAGDGNGRVYQVTFTADDGSGGICTGTVTVCVPHDRRSTICVDDGQFYDSQQP